MIFCSLSELKGESGWTQFDYARTFPLSKDLVRDSCERVSYMDVDEDMFRERYERQSVPVVITHGQLDWQARKKWTVEVFSFPLILLLALSPPLFLSLFPFLLLSLYSSLNYCNKLFVTQSDKTRLILQTNLVYLNSYYSFIFLKEGNQIKLALCFLDNYFLLYSKLTPQ